MRTLLCAAALFSIALLGAGCKKASPIVGKWDASAGAGSMIFEFKEDNAFVMTMNVMGKSFNLKGDYKVDGEKLTITPKDIDIPGAPAADLAKAKSQTAGQLGKPEDLTVKFVSDDEISLSKAAGAAAGGMAPLGGSTTLKRVKDAK